MRKSKLCFLCRLLIHAASALALVTGSFAAAPAQTQTPAQVQTPDALSQPMTLNLRNVPLQTALKTLFVSAGVHNFVIGTDVRGSVSLSVADVPGSLALRQMISSAQPPLELVANNGAYKISVKQAPQTGPRPSQRTQVDVRTAFGALRAKQLYAVPINSYDAYYLATLLGSQGIVEVGANQVNPNDRQQTRTGSGRTGVQRPGSQVFDSQGAGGFGPPPGGPGGPGGFGPPPGGSGASTNGGGFGG